MTQFNYASMSFMLHDVKITTLMNLQNNPIGDQVTLTASNGDIIATGKLTEILQNQDIEMTEIYEPMTTSYASNVITLEQLMNPLPTEQMLTWYLNGISVPDELPSPLEEIIAPVVAPSSTSETIIGQFEKAIGPQIGTYIDCPIKECEDSPQLTRPRLPLYKMIIHLNDDHDWPRERVADWLETLDIDLSFKPTEGEPNGNQD